MEFTKPRVDTAIEQTLSFDEKSGTLLIGWSAKPAVNLASNLAYRLSTSEARALAATLLAYAGG